MNSFSPNSHDSQFTPILLATLLSGDLPEPQCIIPNLLPQGLTFLLGQPRIGKSWLALQIALSTALSNPVLGQTPMQGADVLYLGLQDTPRRISSRCRKLLGEHPIPNGFTWSNQYNPLRLESLTALDHWLTEHPQTRLVVIDSLDLLHPPMRRSGSVCQQEHPLLSQLRTLADHHRLAILLVDCLPIKSRRDPLTDLCRLPALRTADALLLLTRERGQADATLLITGPDLPEQELALSFSQESMRWTLLGHAADYRLSQQRQDILALLREYEGGPLSPKQIASLLHKDVRAVTKLLHDMSHANQLRLLGRGQYMLAASPASVIPQHHHPSPVLTSLLSTIGNDGKNPALKMEVEQGRERDVEQNNTQHTPEPLPENSSSTAHHQTTTDDIGNGSNLGNIGNIAGGELGNFLPFSDSNLPITPTPYTNPIYGPNEGHNPYFPID